MSALVVALVKCQFENDIDDFQEGDLEDQLEGLEEEEINEKRWVKLEDVLFKGGRRIPGMESRGGMLHHLGSI